jgi:hypothetical protein
MSVEIKHEVGSMFQNPADQEIKGLLMQSKWLKKIMINKDK